MMNAKLRWECPLFKQNPHAGIFIHKFWLIMMYPYGYHIVYTASTEAARAEGDRNMTLADST